MTTPRVALRRRFTRLGGMTAVMLCVVLAAPVFAFVSATKHGIIVPKGAKRSVTAECPGKQRVQFGGLKAEFNVPRDAIVFPTGMRKTSPERWTVYGSSLSATRGSRLAAIAYCGNAKPPAITKQKTVKVALGRTGSATATCPVGTVVVGGGFNTRAFPHFEDVKALERINSRQWRVTILNIAGGGTSVTAIAYCGPGPAPKLRSASIRVKSGRGATVRATCKPGTQLVFGGQKAQAPGRADHLPHVLPFAFYAESKTRWAVSASNGGGTGGRLTALAYCR